MSVAIHVGDCRSVLQSLPEQSIQMCVTSPPYFGLRDYGVDGQIGREQTPEAFVQELVNVFREVRRVLRDDGTLWLNLGDSYARNGGSVESKMNTAHKIGIGLRAAYLAGAMQTIDKVPVGYKDKDLLGIPWRVAFALQADGWYLRQDIIWHKPNPMPESVGDRCTKSHEYIFLLSKSERYFFDSEAIAETTQSGQTRNKRSVWSVPVRPFSGAHFATFPPDLIDPCIRAGSKAGDTVLDPFGGAGTTGLVSNRLDRNALLIEINPTYAVLAKQRIAEDSPLFAEVAVL